MSDVPVFLTEAIDACEREGLDATYLRARVACVSTHGTEREEIVTRLAELAEAEFFTTSPRWSLVRALHHAWCVADLWANE